MPSSSYNCVKPADVAQVTKVAAGYNKMGTVAQVSRAAREAGQYLAGQMTKLVEGESSLRDYRDLGQSFSVFQDQGNIVVGIPPRFNRLVERAEKMDAIYQVAEVAHDLARQSDDVEERFYDSLFSVVKK